jgi:hypothetical protein
VDFSNRVISYLKDADIRFVELVQAMMAENDWCRYGTIFILYKGSDVRGGGERSRLTPLLVVRHELIEENSLAHSSL